MDIRIKVLVKTLVNHSTKITKGENVLICGNGSSTQLVVKELVKAVYAAGANPFIRIFDSRVEREIALNANIEQLKVKAELEIEELKRMDALIDVVGSDNAFEMSDVPSEQLKIYDEYYQKPVTDESVNNTKWVLLGYPNNSMAQLANMSLDSFEEFYYKVCTLDYSRMSKAMDGLVELMEKTDKVHIKGNGTDITFSIKGIPAVKCDGANNIPDGEVFTAPVRDSVNGKIYYNCPSVYRGVTHENIRLEFENGKIIKAESNRTDLLNEILDSDEGARYIGEFALGVNPHITKPMNDILFDEKIMGSFHLTPGEAYEDAYNGNHSAVHWDLVSIQTPEWEGGYIYFDDVLIRKDGLFVLPELESLNPVNLE